jgi:ADP-ribose pyrophosphatase YjhB (NUDIX family)
MRQVATILEVAIVYVPVDGRFVLVQEAKPACRDLWALPGGVIEPGESVVDAVKREVREEAGIEVEPTAILGLEHVRYAPSAGSPSELKLRYLVKARLIGGTLKTVEDAESQRAQLFTMDEARQLRWRDPRYAAWAERFMAGGAELPISAYRWTVAHGEE